MNNLLTHHPDLDKPCRLTLMRLDWKKGLEFVPGTLKQVGFYYPETGPNLVPERIFVRVLDEASPGRIVYLLLDLPVVRSEFSAWPWYGKKSNLTYRMKWKAFRWEDIGEVSCSP